MATGYGRTDARAMRNESTSRGRLDGEYVMTQGAKHLIRFLPPPTDGPFYFKYFIHYLGNETVICPQFTWRGRCPVCAMADHLFRSRDTDEIAQGRKMYRKAAYIANVIDARNPDNGVQLLRFGKQVRDQLVSYFADPDDADDQGIDITDPEEGATIRIEVVPPEQGGGFRKYVCALGKQGPVPFKGWAKKLYNLEETVKGLTKSKKEIDQLLGEFNDENDAPGTKARDEEDEPRPRRSFSDDDASRGASATRGNGRSLDEDEDNDDKPQTRRPATVEEDDPPPRPAARTRPAPVEDDEPIRPARSATRRRFVEEADED